MGDVAPLSVIQLRELTRKHARLLAVLLDSFPPGPPLDYDDTVAATARVLVDYAPVFCDIVSAGTGLTDAEVQRTPWPTVVNLGCAVIERTREIWRAAWPNGFIQNIIRDELRPFSSVARNGVRG